MSMKYEGAGIILTIDRIVRSILAERVAAGQREFIFPAEMPLQAPWQHYDLSSSLDENMMYHIYITVRNEQPRLPPEQPIDAEYEILPSEPLQLPPCSSPSPTSQSSEGSDET